MVIGHRAILLGKEVGRSNPNWAAGPESDLTVSLMSRRPRRLNAGSRRRCVRHALRRGAGRSRRLAGHAPADTRPAVAGHARSAVPPTWARAVFPGPAATA